MPDLGKWSAINPRRVMWFCMGVVALALGVVGVLLPILPTTPFVILAAFAFGRSSPRLAKMLEDSRLFGPIIADWRKNGAIAPRFKALAVVMMLGVFCISLVLSLSIVVLVIQAVCIAGAAMFILSRPDGATKSH